MVGNFQVHGLLNFNLCKTVNVNSDKEESNVYMYMDLRLNVPSQFMVRPVIFMGYN